MKEYKILKGSSVSVLGDKVNRELQDGWELYGNPFTSTDDKRLEYCQALTKGLEEGEKPKKQTFSAI